MYINFSDLVYNITHEELQWCVKSKYVQLVSFAMKIIIYQIAVGLFYAQKHLQEIYR